MSDDASAFDEFDPTIYGLIGNIASIWALLEYKVNHLIWRLANIEHDQLGACITAQIASFPARLMAVTLLARERQISTKYLKALNKLEADHREPLEIRNRAAHDPVGVENHKHMQLQITARGKTVFDLREVTVEKLIADRDKVVAFLVRFENLMDEILVEVCTLPYKPTIIFPKTSHANKKTLAISNE